MNRVITAAIGVPATVLLTLYAPNWLFALVIAAAGAGCLEELMRLGATRLDSRPGRWVLLLGAGVTLSFVGGAPMVLTGLTFAVLIAATVTSFSSSLQEALPKAALATMGILYCGLLPGFLLLLSDKWSSSYWAFSGSAIRPPFTADASWDGTCWLRASVRGKRSKAHLQD